jgi:hypothetical protein
MTELVALGQSDEGSRWIGVRRHQAAAVILGLALVGDWLIRANANLVEGVTGLVIAASALPAMDGLTLFEFFVVGVRFLSRSSWTRIQSRDFDHGTEVSARGRAVVCGFELTHRGRLDLNGRDVALNEALVAFADGLSTSDNGRHFSIHVINGEWMTTTALILAPGLLAPDGWHSSAEVVGRIISAPGNDEGLRLERWNHLRESTGVVKVLRVNDFSGAPAGRHLLERLQFSPVWAQLSLHVEVVDGRRALGIAARAVHRSGSDIAASSSAGFRRTARAARSADRLRESETLVANGRSLLHVGVFVVVRAQDVDELGDRVKAVRQNILAAGLRCQFGAGRQALWYCQQLPGGPGW